jgi:SH3 domain-containing YSC84-like protein 1
MLLHSKNALAAGSLIAMALLMAAPVDTRAATDNSHSMARPSSQPNDAGRDAKDRVKDAVQTVNRLKQDPQLAKALARAKGVFVIPHYGKGALIVGGQGGGGVVLARRGNSWTDPAFFSIGGGSIGAQAGGEAGCVVLLLMTDKALEKFAHSDNTWALNANAGLTVVTWSGRGQAQTGKGDVIVWTDTNGLYGGLTASVTDISPDKDMDQAYYGMPVTSQQILTGAASPNAPNAAPLRNALTLRVASK